MRQPDLFRGTGVALITPFRDAEIDFEALDRMIEHVVTGGVDFIVSLGTTGEPVNMSAAECRRVFDFTIEKLKGRLPLVAGLFGSNYTQKLVRGIRDYDLSGFDAIMSSSPSYIKPTQEGIFQHYMAIEAVSPIPIIIYNVPGRTASNVQSQTILRLANASEKFIAVKEASGDMVQGMQIIRDRPEGFLVLSGDDPTALPLIACGGDGVISVIANALPRAFSSMTRAALEGDMARARKLNHSMLDIHPLLYVEGNPAGVKAVLDMKGLCTPEVRIPLTSVTEKTRHQLEETLKKSGYLPNS